MITIRVGTLDLIADNRRKPSEHDKGIVMACLKFYPPNSMIGRLVRQEYLSDLEMFILRVADPRD